MYDSLPQAGIIGHGYALGSQCLTNQDLIDDYGIKIKPSFVDNNVGSKTRFFLDDSQTTSDLAYQAAVQALAKAEVEVNQLSRLIVATSTADYLSPSTACVVQHKLGGKGFPAFDISAACSGFVYAIDQAIRCIATGDELVLVIGADARSRTLNMKNKRTAFLYGDGAGAVLLRRLKPDQEGFIASHLYADGAGYDAVYVPSVGANQQQREYNQELTMPNGRRIQENAGVGIASLCSDLLAKTPYQFSDIDYFVFHQPNHYLLQAVIDQMNIPDHKTMVNFSEVGNTVAASIPIALSQAASQQRIQPGDLVVVCAVGGGFTGGAHLFRWNLPD